MDNSLIIKCLLVWVLLSQVLLDYASQSKLQQRRANLEHQPLLLFIINILRIREPLLL